MMDSRQNITKHGLEDGEKSDQEETNDESDSQELVGSRKRGASATRTVDETSSLSLQAFQTRCQDGTLTSLHSLLGTLVPWSGAMNYWRKDTLVYIESYIEVLLQVLDSGRYCLILQSKSFQAKVTSQSRSQPGSQLFSGHNVAYLAYTWSDS
jgi:hypothetical protein